MKTSNLRLLIILVAGTIGCRNSKPAVVGPSSMPPSAAMPEQKPALVTAEDAKTHNLVSAKPVQITPPTSLSVVAENGPLEFIVQGHRGQFLRVQIDTGDHESPTAKIAVESESSAGPLKSITPEYCTEDSLFVLGADGAFGVSLDPGGHKEVKLDFSLLASKDPLVDAGIRPEQISFADKSVAEPIPYDHGCELGEPWPASLSIKGRKLLLRIAQVAGYKSMFPQDKGMQILISSLASGAAPDAKNLPYPNWGGDAATVMTARPLLIKGYGWRAWRWIEGSSQDGDYPGNIFFVAEGLTNDQRYFFRATAAIDHEAVKSLSPQNSAKYDETGSRLRLEQALAAADPASFTPNLNELDATVSSLDIRK